MGARIGPCFAMNNGINMQPRRPCRRRVQGLELRVQDAGVERADRERPRECTSPIAPWLPAVRPHQSAHTGHLRSCIRADQSNSGFCDTRPGTCCVRGRHREERHAPPSPRAGKAGRSLSSSSAPGAWLSGSSGPLRYRPSFPRRRPLVPFLLRRPGPLPGGYVPSIRDGKHGFLLHQRRQQHGDVWQRTSACRRILPRRRWRGRAAGLVAANPRRPEESPCVISHGLGHFSHPPVVSTSRSQILGGAGFQQRGLECGRRFLRLFVPHIADALKKQQRQEVRLPVGAIHRSAQNFHTVPEMRFEILSVGVIQ